MPDSFTERVLYPAGVAGYAIDELPGSVILVQRDRKPLRIGMIVPSSYKPSVIPITDSHNYYHSRVTNSAALQGSYLAFTANMSAGDMAELTLSDISRSEVPITGAQWAEIVAQLATWVASHPKSGDAGQRIWIQAVVLTQQVYVSSTVIGSSASAQVGSVVGVLGVGGKTEVHHLSEDSVKSVQVAFEAFDVDELVANGAAKSETGGTAVHALLTLSLNSGLSSARFKGEKGVISGTIVEAQEISH